MKIEPRKLKGSFEISFAPRGDNRGYFMRLYDAEIFKAAGLNFPWAQENEARTEKAGVLRGMHFQRPPHAETKMVRCVEGAVFDAFVDLRQGSPTYGQWDALVLSAEKKNMVVIPRGFAHGYFTLTPNSVVIYKVDNAYTPEHEGGLRWNDPAIGIEWPLGGAEPILSDRDKIQPLLKDIQPLAEAY